MVDAIGADADVAARNVAVRPLLLEADDMVSCMVFLLYSTKWRTETHADSVPVGEDGVTEGVGRYPAPMAACTAAWAHPGHAPLPRHARQGCMAGCMEFGCTGGCISLYFAV